MPDVDCVLLAAGASTRMGRWKMLLPWRGCTVVEASAEAALGACARLLVVVGHRGDELERLFAGRERVQIVRNPDWERGLFSSVRAGVAAVRSERFFVALADMPLVGPGVYRRLLDAPPALVVRPCYRGKSGHPVLLDRRMIPPILAEPAAGTMRDVIARFESCEVAVEDPATLLDVDEPEDYRRLSGE